jgi:hypothetical protein
MSQVEGKGCISKNSGEAREDPKKQGENQGQGNPKAQMPHSLRQGNP